MSRRRRDHPGDIRLWPAGELPPGRRIQAVDVVCAPCQSAGRGDIRLARFGRYTDPNLLAGLPPGDDGTFVEGWKEDGVTVIPLWTVDPETGVEKVHLECRACGHHPQMLRSRVLDLIRETSVEANGRGVRSVPQ